MLPKKNRLLSKKDFDFLKRKGFKRNSDSFDLLFLPTGNPSSRVGIIISTKISLKAVARNKAKRKLREAIYSQLPQKGFDFLFLGKKEILTSSFSKISKEIREVFSKINA